MTATDNFSSTATGLGSPTSHAAAITPHNTNELSFVTRAIYVGGAGDLKVTTVGGSTVTFAAVPVGTTVQVRAKIVFATGTSATNLLALW